MFLDLLAQRDQHLVYFADVSRVEFDQLVQVAKFEESVRVNIKELSKSCAICLDGDALQHPQLVTDSLSIRIEWSAELGRFSILRTCLTTRKMM